jgi:membrane-bound metal-dependent hydrolase YbcI (DUF457 family)
MFLGHFAVGFAAKRAAPRSSLAALMTAALFLDVLWPLFLWLGLEQVRIAPGITAFNPLDFESYPISHSLAMALVWAGILGISYDMKTRYRRGAIWMGIAVFSHWLLDFVAHRPDLPLLPGPGPRVGLGLWNSVPWTVVTEVGMFFAGLAFYLSATRPRGRVGGVSLWSLVVVLLSLYALVAWGPPPPSVDAIRRSAAAVPVLILWFVWIDRTRVTRVPELSA